MKAMRTMFVAALLCAAAAAFAVPSFTPVIDGVKDAGWGNTPDHSSTSQALPTEFNLDGGLYVTDDAEWVYFGYDADNDPWADGKSVHVHIVFDVGSTAVGGTFACWGANNVAYTHTYKPEYDLVMQWNTDNQNSQFTGLNTWTINTWVQQPEITTDAGGGNQWTEVAIRKNQIGTPGFGTTLNISMWLRPAWDSQGGVACLPADATFPSDNAAVAHPLSQQFAYSIQTAYGDAVAPRLLSVRQIDRRSVELLFNEPMNPVRLNNSSYYVTHGWPFTGIRYVNDLQAAIWNFSNFTDGTTYAISLLSGITDVAGNPIDANFDSLSWTSPLYSDVLFRVEDPGATHDSIWFKGSFNFYREYDASWQGGNYLLYDDGTNGDVVPGDHVFSRRFEMVPNGGTPNFEWGCVDENDNWLIVGPNQSFSLVDSNDITVTYVIPNPTINPVTVTFRCDVECLLGQAITPDSVSVAGPFNGWSGQVMADGDLDGQYTLDVLFPAGSVRTQEFKFRFHIGGGTTWEDVPNRPLEVNDANPTQDLGNIFWNDWVCPPSELTVYSNGTEAVLYWNGPSRAHFEVFGHTVSDSIIENGTILGNTPNDTYTVTPLLNIQYFQVRAYKP
ncbi:Ig-like domain-containing protein [bacterium]|nr:Ig-like domain-containing protein [bacterium]